MQTIMEEKHFGNVWFIPGKKKGKYPYCHSVYLEGEGILIDPSSDRNRLAEIRELHGVGMVWLSHWHEDHFMHLDLFEDVPLWIHHADAPPLSDLEILLDWYGLQDGQERQSKGQLIKDRFRFKARKPQGYLQGGETIRLRNLTVDVIASPGHTPGHLAFFFREPEVLFLGDYDLTPFGPWYGDAHSSIEDLRKSLNLLKEIPARVWLTGHEQGVFEEPPGELWDEYERVIDIRERKLLKALDQPKNMDDIVNLFIIYGRPREPRVYFDFGERALMQKHLELLEKQGIVRFEKGRYHRLV